MPQSGLWIDDQGLTQIFKGSPRQFANLAKATQEAAYLPGIRDPPRDEYPLFEHLLIWLYGRWISPGLSKTTLLGQALSTTQKTNLGEAIDYLLYSNFIPLNADLGHRVSLLSLCYHEKFGFKDDPVLLQRMWYIRAHVLLEDSPNGAGEGERWKWYDYRLALVIYSWVRHNRKYHGCPKVSCHCRQLIDLYGLSIGTFKALYMSLERQCVPQLQFVRSSEPVWSPAKGRLSSLSRADDVKLYFIPKRKVWPHCFSTCVAEPEPSPNSLVSSSALTIGTPPTTELHAPTPHAPSTLATAASSLPPPHPSLPARPIAFTATPSTPTSIKGSAFPPVQAMVPIVSSAVDPQPPRQPNVPPTQPPPPRDPPPPPPPAQNRPATTVKAISHHIPATGASDGGENIIHIGRYGPQLLGMKFSTSPSRSSALNSPIPPPPQPAPGSLLQSPTVSKEFVTAPSTPAPTTETPIPAPALPSAARKTLGLPRIMIPAVSGSPQAIPSAPRSMREVKGASSGPIPTGPRALSGVTKSVVAIPNASKFPTYAGVPSAPRSMRGPPTKGNVANGVGSGAAGGRAANKAGGVDSNKEGDDKMAIDEAPVAPGISHTSVPPSAPKSVAESVTSESSTITQAQGPAKYIPQHSPPLVLNLSRPGPSAPRVLPLTTGKRSRSDTKADEILAQIEMDAKARPSSVSHSDKAGPSKITTPPAVSAPPSLPPAKRVKPLPESESPTDIKKTFLTRKVVAKDGVAILAAVSKQKNGVGAKAMVQAKETEGETPQNVGGSKSVIVAASKTPETSAHRPTSNGNKEVTGTATISADAPPEKYPELSPPDREKQVMTSKSTSSLQFTPVVFTGTNQGAPISGSQKEDAPQTGKTQTPPSRKGDPNKGSIFSRSHSGNAQIQVGITTTIGSDKATANGDSLANSNGKAVEAPRGKQDVGPDGSGVEAVPNRALTRASRAKKVKQGVEAPLVEETPAPSASALHSLSKSGHNNEQRVSKGQAEPDATEVGVAGNPSSAEAAFPTKKAQGTDFTPALSETRPKRKAGKKNKPESSLPATRGKSKQSGGKASKPANTLKDDIIELSSDDSVAADQPKQKAQKNAMEVDPPNDTPVALLAKSTVAKIPSTSSRRGPSPSGSKGAAVQLKEVNYTSRIGSLAATLQDLAPFPTVLVSALDPEKRRKTAQHEASRLMCALVAVGIPIDWWMIGVTENGFIIRDEASPLIAPLLTETVLIQLYAIGIAIELTPAELSSDSEEDTPIHMTVGLQTLPSRLQRSDSLPLVIFDGHDERRLRSEEAEERRLRGLVDRIIRRSLLDAAMERNTFESVGPEEVVCLVCPKDMPSPLSPEEISRLGKAGLVVHRGDIQLAGPLPVGSNLHSRPLSNGGSFDWRAMQTEVMKMKLPWEMGDDRMALSSTSPYAPSTPTYSFTEAEDSPASAHFRQLLRPNLWSASGTFSKMATAGMRWEEFSGVDPDSSDESGDEEGPSGPSLGAVIHT